MDAQLPLPTTSEQPAHAPLAIASFFTALGSAAVIFGIFLIHHVLDALQAGGSKYEREEKLSTITGIIFFSALLADLIAIGLAGVSLARGHNRLFPILALVIGVILFAFCFYGFHM